MTQCFLQQFQLMSQSNNNTSTNNPEVKLQQAPRNNSGQGPINERNHSLPHLGAPIDQDQSQFLELNQQMKEKLKSIDRKKDIKHAKMRKNSMAKNLNKSRNNRSLPNIDKQSLPRQKKKSMDKKVQKQIKKQFVHKMKEWQRQRQQLEHKKQVMQSHKQKVKMELEEKKHREEEEEKQFHRLQKKKQLQQKIGEIEARRRMREESLKNAVLKRSYNGVPKYLEYEQKFAEKEEEKAMLDLKLIKNKKEKMKMSPEELKAHEKAYIDRIKQRLNMKSPQKKKQQTRQTNSDFNLYLRRSEELKKAQLQKIIRRKKFQEKISRIPITVDEEKKKEILISKDKAKNPQKYHILERKALNDQQIYNQFMGVQIQLDPKKKGNDYLKQLKNEPKKNRVQHRVAAKSQQLERIRSPMSLPKLPKKVIQQPEQPRSERVKPRKESTVRSFSQLSVSKSYERTLIKTKQEDSRYMNALRDKLAMLK